MQTSQTPPTIRSNANLYDVIIIGAGAAGLMAAATAGHRGRRVLLLDHADTLAEKIRISGGGRCNFTNLDIRPECYLSNNPRFSRSALAQYTQHDFIALVEKHKIAWHEKTLGQLFCDDSSQQIITMLDDECKAAKVNRLMKIEVKQVAKKDDQFIVETSRGNFTSASLIIATGGLALPKVGATPLGYKIAEQFGLNIIPPTPALVPLALHQEDLERLAPLAGISLDVEVSVGKTTFRENMLLTHKGLSGPAILQISSYWLPGQHLSINLLPENNVRELLQEHVHSDKKVANLLIELGWPRRFTEAWLTMQRAKDARLKELTSKKLQRLAEQIERWQIMPNATQGYRLAEVTRGGVDTKELSSKTMQANNVPNLYFIGEVVDVIGWLGGYNFQWAWSSGAVVGRCV